MTTQPQGAADLEGLAEAKARLSRAVHTANLCGHADDWPAEQCGIDWNCAYAILKADPSIAEALAATKQDSTDTLLEQNRVLREALRNLLTASQGRWEGDPHRWNDLDEAINEARSLTHTEKPDDR